MTVMIRCRCGHEASATAFCLHTSSRQEVREVNGKKVRVAIDTTPPNLWGCPKCKARWLVTKHGIVPQKNEAETQAETRARLRKAWGLDRPMPDRGPELRPYMAGLTEQVAYPE